eukprot:6629205-Pyramimonas_sp.AAC.1
MWEFGMAVWSFLGLWNTARYMRTTSSDKVASCASVRAGHVPALKSLLEHMRESTRTRPTCLSN